ncbi:mycofactocin biosynthesis glycosyltransferase MftF [uncultured Amnibacterium sp.]|uniref:mycofactocin biosynthesis glycosyltransferase MftF n=1 Tax=uncultured Amnibacterium sp. TaxID=1631851 RepID=UPI0035C94FEA
MTLPAGFAVRLARRTRVVDGGRALVGGHPTRVLHLKPAALSLLRGGVVRVGSPAAAALADRLLDTGMADPVLDSLPDRTDPVTDAVTVVVPVRDRPAELRRLLASVPEGLPVIVVDDASRDPAAVAAVAAAAGARLIPLTANVGPGGARNAGLAVVTTPVTAFVDSDIVLRPDTIGLLLKHFADPKVAMAVPRIVGLDGTATWIGRYEDTCSALDLGEEPATVRPLSPVSWASTACVVARTEALQAGFDAGMRVGEDVDLGWRLIDAGWRVRYEPAARAGHDHRVRFADWLGRRFVYGTAAAPLAARHPDAVSPAVLAPWSTAVLLALLAQRRWSLPLAAAVSVGAALRIRARLVRNDQPLRLAAWLTGNGLLAATTQGMALLLRHWWPLAALGCLVSGRMRRAVLAAAVVDVAVEYRRDRARLDPLRYGLLRRLDDLAYGAGVWWSAIRGRSVRALLPDIRSGRAR